MSQVQKGFDFERHIGLVNITSKLVLEHIKEGLVIGSRRDQLSWKDFTFKCNSTFDPDNYETFDDLVTGGVPFLDALVISYADPKEGDVVITHREPANDIIVNYLSISKGLFCWFFSLYTQGRAVGAGNNNFLSSVLGLGKDWPVLVKNLTSANIEHFPKGWVREVKMTGLDEAAKNRLALGAAGQRFLQSLVYLSSDDFKEGKNQERQFIENLKNWTGGKVYWDLHPLLKSGNVITVTKSLNKSIEDCLFHGLKSSAISKLVTSKILFSAPKEQPAHAQWRNLDPNSLPPLTQPIFN